LFRGMMEQLKHLNLDDAWRNEPFALPVVEAREWGPRLRFSAPPRLIAEFYREHEENLAVPFLLYGSGDFHYLTALRLRSVAGPVGLVSFDNHPDWDVRPPKWGCGGWINRALELPHIEHVAVWGCGNFECWWPHRIFGNRRAERAGILEVHPWADDQPAKDRQRRGAILRENWRQRFAQFSRSLADKNIYITIDLDCLRIEEAVTNWESGRFSVVDLQWALGSLRESCRIVGGDICGAYSPPKYARRKQRFAAEFDHPKLRLPDEDEIRAINLATLEKLWPLLAQPL
jgi:arginase family enzyme